MSIVLVTYKTLECRRLLFTLGLSSALFDNPACSVKSTIQMSHVRCGDLLSMCLKSNKGFGDISDGTRPCRRDMERLYIVTFTNVTRRILFVLAFDEGILVQFRRYLKKNEGTSTTRFKNSYWASSWICIGHNTCTYGFYVILGVLNELYICCYSEILLYLLTRVRTAGSKSLMNITMIFSRARTLPQQLTVWWRRWEHSCLPYPGLWRILRKSLMAPLVKMDWS